MNLVQHSPFPEAQTLNNKVQSREHLVGALGQWHCRDRSPNSSDFLPGTPAVRSSAISSCLNPRHFLECEVHPGQEGRANCGSLFWLIFCDGRGTFIMFTSPAVWLVWFFMLSLKSFGAGDRTSLLSTTVMIENLVCQAKANPLTTVPQFVKKEKSLRIKVHTTSFQIWQLTP